ncbi:MAG: hypothetical protein IPJ76_02155 [Flavobacteriales bacterium]|nr:MAG: hypothetical protein IPJ76_02155 [Flavobacteriales bacterium]
MAAQRDESLTKEFADLSAKERSKLAKQEEAAATNDAVYQDLMARAEKDFAAGRYDNARTLFREARERRPLNVYPKVKLEDLEALVTKRAAEEAAKAEPNVDHMPEPIIPDTAKAPIVFQAAAHSPDPLPPTRPKAEPKPAALRTEQRAAPPEDPSAPVQEGEREYVEGNAKVLEIVVREGKRTVVYKKVKHPWGQLYFFRDGESIGDRVWRERFGNR